jgi:predicted RND superfamily exporter protein
VTALLGRLYDAVVLRRPLAVIGALALLCGLAATQLPKLRIDASADSLMLRGDPALEFFREVGKRYSAEDFLLLTWQPDAPLLSDESLLPLRAMADELRALPGVASVVTVWDVPLLESPPVSLSDISSPQPLPSLSEPGIDRELALREFTSSPIYADLLVGRSGDVTAVQVNLTRDDRYFELLERRESLRGQAGTLDAAGRAALEAAEAAFKAYSAIALQHQSEMVDEVRAIADRYREHARIFVGGVPMIAADMVSFVRSDLVVFGAAIVGIMMLILAVIFRRVRWVVIPLVTCAVSVTLLLGLLAALDWRMTVISSNSVAVLLIVTMSIAIHLVVRYRELHAEDRDGDLRRRVRETVRSMVVPCFYTAATTMVAFVSLVVSGLQPVIDFGWMMAVGISIALGVAFLLVPALMLAWPTGRPLRGARAHAPMTLHFARITDHHGALVLGVSALACVLIAIGAARLEVENRFIDYFKKSTEIYQGMELLDRQLGGTIPLDIVISAPDAQAPLPGLEEGAPEEAAPLAEDDPFAEDAGDFAATGSGEAVGAAADPFVDDWGADPFAGDAFGAGEDSFEPSYWFSLDGMQTIDMVHALVDARAETGKVLSLSTTFSVVKDLLGDDIGSVELALVQRSLPQDVADLMVNPYFDADLDEARVTVRVKETSRDLRRDAFLRELEQQLHELPGVEPGQLRFTGMLVLYNNVLQSLFRSQILTLGAVFFAILAMFWLLFRSPWLALIALAPNLLAAGLVLGVMGLAGIPLDIMSITIAAIVVGIGVDDCVHYVYRYRREFSRDRDYLATMYRCHGSIGRALYYTTVTVVVGFSALTLSNFNPSLYFGLLTVLAMIAAVLGALLLLPRLLIVFRPLGPEGA